MNFKVSYGDIITVGVNGMIKIEENRYKNKLLDVTDRKYVIFACSQLDVN